jgi:hypothetical protein
MENLYASHFVYRDFTRAVSWMPHSLHFFRGAVCRFIELFSSGLL